MFYVSKVSPYFFALAILNLFVSLFYKGMDIKLSWIIAVFGFIAHTIMSAMYQIVPNSQNRALKFPKLSYFVFFLSALSSLLFYLNQTSYASALYAVTSTLFVFHILLSVKNYKPPTVRFLTLGSLYFLFGSYLLVLHQLGYVSLAFAIHFVTLGFMLNVVFGVELAWIPMLTMEQLNIKHANRLFYLSLLSLPLFLASFYFMNYKVLAYLSILVFVFLAFYLWIIYSVFANRRMPREIPLAVKYLLLALIFLPFGMLIGTVASSLNLVSHLVLIHVDLLVYGFTATTIMGGLFHLLPRILYGKFIQEGKEKVSISDFVDEAGMKKLFPFVPVGVFLMVFLDALGLSSVSFVPYAILWVVFIKHLFGKIFIKEVQHV